MQKITQRTDFSIKVRFRDSEGNPRTIPDNIHLSYSTPCSTPISFKYDGIDTPQCKVADGGTALLLLFEKPLLSGGQLQVRRKFSVPSTLFEDGKRDFEHVDHLPIFIVSSLNDNCNHINEQAKLAFEEIVTIEVGPRGEKGEKGEKGDSLDYSILTEQVVPGEFFPDKNGVRKQVYTRTFVDTFPATMPDYKTFELSSPTPISTGLVEAHGRVKLGGNTWQMASDVFVFTALNKIAINLSGKEDWLGAKYTIMLKYTK